MPLMFPIHKFRFLFYVLFTVFFFSTASESLGLPKLNAPVELPSTFDGVITVYADSENTNQVRRYWLIPSTARIVRRQDGKLAFGLVHSGVSSFDRDGINV